MHSLNENDDVDYKAMKKAELESLCVEKGLKKSGKKADLIERLEGKTTEFPDAKTITKILEGMEGCVLDQRTPKRVAHRRADKIRKRSVISVSEIAVKIIDGAPEVEVNLRCESGTYVKETVHGDGGRTNPSVSGLLGARCEVIWLDVADIHAD
jgi:tRNA pseudouridine synthase 10